MLSRLVRFNVAPAVACATSLKTARAQQLYVHPMFCVPTAFHVEPRPVFVISPKSVVARMWPARSMPLLQTRSNAAAPVARVMWLSSAAAHSPLAPVMSIKVQVPGVLVVSVTAPTCVLNVSPQRTAKTVTPAPPTPAFPMFVSLATCQQAPAAVEALPVTAAAAAAAVPWEVNAVTAIPAPVMCVQSAHAVIRRSLKAQPVREVCAKTEVRPCVLNV